MSEIANIAVVGLTGQSGAGKTTVCQVFKDNGFEVINADLIARQLMVKGSPCLNEVIEWFGREYLTEDGELNRKKLGMAVFSNEEQLKQLNGICYPYITYEILQQINKMADNGKKYVLLDAPTLFESRADDFCKLIISVTATEKNRIGRLVERDNLSLEQVKKRISSQHTEHFFVNHSDYIIKNNKTIEALKEKAQEVSDKVKEYFECSES